MDGLDDLSPQQLLQAMAALRMNGQQMGAPAPGQPGLPPLVQGPAGQQPQPAPQPFQASGVPLGTPGAAQGRSMTPVQQGMQSNVPGYGRVQGGLDRGAPGGPSIAMRGTEGPQVSGQAPKGKESVTAPMDALTAPKPPQLLGIPSDEDVKAMLTKRGMWAGSGKEQRFIVPEVFQGNPRAQLAFMEPGREMLTAQRNQINQHLEEKYKNDLTAFQAQEHLQSHAAAMELSKARLERVKQQAAKAPPSELAQMQREYAATLKQVSATKQALSSSQNEVKTLYKQVNDAHKEYVAAAGQYWGNMFKSSSKLSEEEPDENDPNAKPYLEAKAKYEDASKRLEGYKNQLDKLMEHSGEQSEKLRGGQATPNKASEESPGAKPQEDAGSRIRSALQSGADLDKVKAWAKSQGLDWDPSWEK